MGRRVAKAEKQKQFTRQTEPTLNTAQGQPPSSCRTSQRDSLGTSWDPLQSRQHSKGHFVSDRPVDANKNSDRQLRVVWQVWDLTERVEVAGYEVVGRRPPVPETNSALREHNREKKKKNQIHCELLG